MKIVGIDYSMSSPCACFFDTNKGDITFDNCTFLVISDYKIKKHPLNIEFRQHKNWTTPDERYHNIASIFIDLLIDCDIIYIEDYSFGSKGKIFHIAENTEVLRYNLFLRGKAYKKVPPKSIKKFATGKGNANKESMYEWFEKTEKKDLLFELDMKKIQSPLTDIVDSYFLCKYALSEL